MAQGDPKLESLHQQASEQYLQGEFLQALKIWRDLLQIDPRDDRAREGARLCEMLAKESGVEVPRMEPLPPRPADPPEDLEAGLDRIGEVLAEELPGDWMAGDPPPAMDRPVEPPADDASMDFDFDLADLRSEPQAPTEDPGLDLELDAVLGGDSMPEPEPGPDLALPDEVSPSDDELKLRIAELMADARGCHERGDHEGALQALSRLTILDDENEEARSFSARIRAEMQAAEAETAAAIAPAVPPAAPTDGADLNHEPLDLAGAASEGIGLDLDLAVGSAPEPGDAEGLDDDLDLDAAPPALEAPLATASGTAASGGHKKLMLIAAAAVALIAVAAFLATQLLGGGSAAGSAEPPAVALARPGGDAPRPAPTGSNAPAPPEVVATPPAGKSVDELLGSATAAFEQGDYAAAVVGFNQVLALDPGQPDAIQGLNVAAERYREEKENERKRAAAIQSFNQGDYRNALRMFYRMPAEGSDGARVQRWIVNGWYNMAIQALMAGDCTVAESHVREALVLAPDDPGLQKAAELALVCNEAVRNRAYYGAVESLGFRSIDD